MDATPRNDDPIEALLRESGWVRSLAARLTRSDEEADELVQESWLAALRHRPRADRSLRPWLATVVRNATRTTARDRSARRHVERAGARDEGAVPAPEERLEQLELQELLLRLVRELPEELRDVCLLRYHEGLDSKRIGARIGVPAGTVRSRLRRAVAELRRRLDERYDGDRAAWTVALAPLAGWERASAVAGASATGLSFLALPALALLLLGIGLAAYFWLPLLTAEAPRVEVAIAEGMALPVRREGARAGAEPDLAPDVASTRGSVGGHSPRADRRLTIQAVLEVGGEPVAGARVALLELGAANLERTEALLRETGDPMRPYEAREGLAVQGETDATGRASLAWSGDPAVALVERDVWAGSTEVVPGEVETDADGGDVVTVRLSRERLFVVRTVDRSGRPCAGVPVEVCARVNELLQLFTRTTGADGTLRLRRISDLVRVRGPIVEPATYGVRLALPGSPRELATLSADFPVTLRLPETGSLAVRVLSAPDRLVAFPGTVQVSETRGTPDDGRAELTAELVGGVARFPFIGAGRERLRVHVSLPSIGVSEKLECRVPRFAGDEATVDVLLDDRPSLTGRALGPNGRPLTGAKLIVKLQTEERREVQHTQIETDGQGRFRCELEDDSIAVGALRVLLLRYRRGWDRRADAFVSAVPQLGVTELGDLHLKEIGSVVSGRCVQLNGEPVAGLEVEGQQDEYRSAYVAKTDGDGSFVLRGLFAAEVELSVRSGEFVVSGPHLARRGEEDFELVVAVGGSLAGSFRSPIGEEEWTPLVMLYDSALYELEELLGASSKRRFVERHYGEIHPDGTFTVTGLETGSYHALIYRAGTRLLAISDVRVERGELSRDPRLQSIDLDALVRRVTVFVTDPSGKPLDVAARAVFDDGRELGANGRGGELVLELPTDVAGVRLRLLQSGFRPTFVDDPQNGQRVVMRKGIPVRLHSRGRPVLEREGRRVALSLGLVGEDPRFSAPSASIPEGIARGETVEALLPGPGLYRLQRSTHSSFGDGMMAASQPEFLEGAPTLEIIESDAGRTFELELPDAVLD